MERKVKLQITGMEKKYKNGDGVENIKEDRVFITHSGISQERIDLVKREVEKTGLFREIFVTRAGCTISSHCGPNTLGVLFMTK